jgi:hypothetical protein
MKNPPFDISSKCLVQYELCMGEALAIDVEWRRGAAKDLPQRNGGAMIKKVTPRLCLVFTCMAFACVTLRAQAPQIALSPRSQVIQPANGPDPGLIKIHSNLGSKKDAYDDGISWDITGPGNLHWGVGYLAMPFTPKVNSVAMEVLIALGYIGGGSNSGTIAIFTDAAGVPGKALQTWVGYNFPPAGDCCQLVAFKNAHGIPLQGGTQYWIVAATGSANTGWGSQQAQYQWDFAWNDLQGKVAFLNGNTNGEWLAFKDNLAAFAVYGTIQ